MSDDDRKADYLDAIALPVNPGNTDIWIEQARWHYICGTITVDEFEADVWEALNGRAPVHTPWCAPSAAVSHSGEEARIIADMARIVGMADVTQGA